MAEARKVIARWLTQLALPLGVAAALVLGVVAVGRYLGEREMPVSLGEVECIPPEGMTRQQFLQETEYLSGESQPPDLAQVSNALKRHPWVLRVNKVQRLPGGRVRAELAYRWPMLAVDHPPREVDEDGVLLPRSEKRKGLPLLKTKVMPPTGRPGQVWGDVRVTAAAQVVALVQHRLELADCTVEVDEGEVVFRTPKCRVVWGRPPGHEKPNEAPAVEKLRRLPDVAALVGQECDLRPAAGTKQRPLTP